MASQELDCILDYVLSFLEGDHAKSGKLSEQDQTTIVQKVKSTLAWKSQDRRQSENEEKVINAMMSRIVSRM